MVEHDNLLKVSWVRIVEEFSLRYDSVFLQTTAKAHLDYSSCIVDGAKDKWCQVVLLDTMIAFQEGMEPKISQQRRRQFNQYLAFRESIIVVASESWITHIKSRRDTLNILEIKMPNQILIYGTEIIHWDSIDKLKAQLSTKNKYRTKVKQENIVDTLLDVVSSKNLTVKDVLHNLVQRLYREHFHLAHRDPDQHIGKDEKINFIEGNEYFEHLERFCISFVDAVKREASSQGLHPLYLFPKYHDEVGPQIKKQRVSNSFPPSYGSSSNSSSINNNSSIYSLDTAKYGSNVRTYNSNSNLDRLNTMAYKNSIRSYDRIDNNNNNNNSNILDVNSPTQIISNNNAIVQALMRLK